MNDTLVHSVKKAMAILDILVFGDIEKKGVGLFDLSRRLMQKPNTLHNILKTMSACGYVSQNDKSLYLAGPKCAEIASVGGLAFGGAVIERTRPVLQELGNRINESIVLTVLINGNRIPLIIIEDNNFIKVNISSDEMAHIYEKPTGRILVSYADNFSLKMIKESWGYPGTKWGGAFDDCSLDSFRAVVRNRGYEIELEHGETIVSFAVPVRDVAGKVRYALGSYAPVFRCDSKKQSVILRELMETAACLEKLL